MKFPPIRVFGSMLMMAVLFVSTLATAFNSLAAPKETAAPVADAPQVDPMIAYRQKEARIKSSTVPKAAKVRMHRRNLKEFLRKGGQMSDLEPKPIEPPVVDPGVPETKKSQPRKE